MRGPRTHYRVPMPAPLVSLRGVTKRYGGVTALDGVSFDVAAGSLHAVCGENGAGKSTLMKVLAGVVTDHGGEVLLRGEPVRFAATRDAEAAGVAIIHQELNLVGGLSAAANVFLGRERRTRLGLLDERAMRRGAADLFAELGADLDPAARVDTLRVGDAQLVEIARALAVRAETELRAETESRAETKSRAGGDGGRGSLLIMDEPTSALTGAEAERLFAVIGRLRAAGVTVLYISHKMDEVFRLADAVTVLRDGRHVCTVPLSDTTPREVIHRMVGREVELATADGTAGETAGHGEPGAAVLSVKNLSLPHEARPGRWRLRDVSLELRAGRVLGVAGLMGAGRTELLESLFGLRPAATGEVLLRGEPVRFDHPAGATAAGLALVPEDRKRAGLLGHLSVRANLTACTLGESTRAGLLSRRRERAAAAESVDRLGIRLGGGDVRRGLEANVLGLSGGNQQKCVLARWLRTNPDVLLLDDPTRGVDVGAKAELYRTVRGLCGRGMAILLTSSELPELFTLCDRLLVLCEGRVTAEFDRPAFDERAVMEAATGGARSRGVATPRR